METQCLLPVDLLLLCSEKLPDGGTPVPKHVVVLYLPMIVFY
jgi:hypothetical protein